MTVNYKKISNGLLIACDSIKNVQSISFKIVIKIGSRHETIGKNTGISHFMEHMAFKGTKLFNKKQIASSLDELGGSYNAYTSREYTAYTCKVPRIYFEEAFAIFADIIQNSIFDEEEIKIERDVILQEMAMVNDDPSDIIFDKLYEISYGKHGDKEQIFGKSILGSVSDLLKLEKKDFLDFSNEYYHNENMIIGVAGNIEFNELEEICEKYFQKKQDHESNLDLKKQFSNKSSESIDKNKQSSLNLIKPVFTGGYFVEERDVEQVHILIGAEGFSKKHPDYFKAQIASSILGGGMSSRLFQRIREDLGLAYNVSSWNVGYQDTGIFGIYGACSPEKANLFMSECFKEIKKMTNLTSKLDKNELESMKKQIRCGILMQSDGTSSRVNHLISSLIMYDKYISGEELIEKINEISVDDIKDTINNVFFKNKNIADGKDSKDQRFSLAIIKNKNDIKIEPKKNIIGFDEFCEVWG